MIESKTSLRSTSTGSGSGAGLRALGRLSKIAIILLAFLLILTFIAFLFPWNAVSRRLEYEIGRASGSSVSISELAPAFTARGPVLRARNVTILHPAVERVQISALEVAPRPSRSWFSGDPALRIWADTELGLADGVLELGEAPAYVGNVSRVELSQLPLRLEATGISLSGELTAEANVALSPNGTLQGRVDFASPSLVIETQQLPLAIPFTRAHGTLEILENGATQIEFVELEGPLLNGEFSGEIGLVHRSQSPPIDLQANFHILDRTLQQLAPAAGFPLDAQGKATVQVRGTLNQPQVTRRGAAPGRSPDISPATAARSQRQR